MNYFSYHAIIGILFYFAFVNLSQFFINKDKAYLNFFGYLLCNSYYMFLHMESTYDSAGLIVHVMGDLGQHTPNFILFLSYGFSYQFYREVLELKPISESVYNWLKRIGWIYIYVLAPFALIGSIILDRGMSYQMIMIGLLVLSFLLAIFWVITFYRLKPPLGNYIITGALLFSLGSITSCFLIIANDNVAIVGSSAGALFWPFKIGILGEILLFTIALSKRSILIEKEKNVNEMRLENEVSKNKIYTNITHEFLTPLTVIKGLNANNKGDKQIQQKIDNNSEQLLSLVNQMLSLSKMESGFLSHNPLQYDIVPLLNYITESYTSKAHEKSISLNNYSEIETLTMDVDVEKLKIILGNLIVNAVKYTPSFGKIAVVTKYVNKKTIEILVKDSGRGISKEQLPHIFDRFYQVDKNSKEGVGIGLSIVKEFVAFMNGKITVESEVNKGSTFRLMLPITRSASMGSETDYYQSLKMYDSDNESVSLLEQEIDANDVNTILLIEDNRDVAFYINKVLQGKYKITHALNGREGLKLAQAKIPDIIITDLMMPSMDGIEMCRRLKANIKTSHIPVIMLTAKTKQSDKLEGLSVGADAYLTKPFDEKELLLRIKSMIKRRDQIQSQFAENATIPKSLSKDQLFLQKVNEFIEENMHKEDLSINDLCRAVNLERSQLYRKLKALTGQSASIMIRTRRLLKAKRLIKEDGDKSITEIAYLCGFKDTSYFTKCFKEYFGILPSIIRGD